MRRFRPLALLLVAALALATPLRAKDELLVEYRVKSGDTLEGVLTRLTRPRAEDLPLLKAVVCKLSGLKVGKDLEEGSHLIIPVGKAVLDVIRLPEATPPETLLARHYAKLGAKNAPWPFFAEANVSVLPLPLAPGTLIPKGTRVQLPRLRLLQESYDEILAHLVVFRRAAFDEAVTHGRAEAVERQHQLLRTVLLPAYFARFPKRCNTHFNPVKQIDFDRKIVSQNAAVERELLSFRAAGLAPSWELAWKIREGMMATQQQIASVIDDTHVTVKPVLLQRLNDLQERFAAAVRRVLRDRMRRLSKALASKKTSRAQDLMRGILYNIRPAIRDVFAELEEQRLLDTLARLHRLYVAPATGERSLWFSNHFHRFAAFLAAPSKTDNYRYGFKISDVEYQLLKSAPDRVLHLDCSGFVGRVYREMARMVGYDMKTFDVGSHGVVGSVYLITPEVSKKIALAAGADPLSICRQGDIFYWEHLQDSGIMGRQARHVSYFDHFDTTDSARLYIWDATPGGVRHRRLRKAFILRRLNNTYGKPRNGVYRLNHMDEIDVRIARRGALF